jgi:hypothetical protein
MWEGDVRALLIAMAIALAGCVAQRLNTSMYTRTDGRPVDPAHQQAVFAQCKGEGATASVQFTGGPYGVVERERKEADVVNACMARNGYIQARQ